MTYRTLLDKIHQITLHHPDALDDDVTLYVRENLPRDEFFQINNILVQTGDDVLHNGHIYLET